MSCFGSIDVPDEAYVSVRTKLIEDDGEIDRPTRHRRVTDRNFIFVMAIFFGLLACMIIYCATLERKNDWNFHSFTSGVTKKQSGEIGMEIPLGPVTEMLAIVITLIIVTILLLRYFIGVFIWLLLIIGSLTAIAISLALWYLFFTNKDRTHGLIVFPVVATVITFVIVFLIYATRKRIQMIIQVFKEASKAIGTMPQLYIQPAISFLAFMTSVATFYYFFTIVIGASSAKANGPDDIVVCTYVLLYWGCIWLTYFYKGCQSMVVGGTIATWYYRRDKTNLGSPMWTTTKNVVRYHLGTVAFGSFLMLLMQIIKSMADFFTKRRKLCCCCACLCCFLKNFLKYFEGIIKYFTKMSYIMTSIHGQPFCTGCREAIVLLIQHAFSLIQLKCFCKFVLALLQLIITSVALVFCRLFVDPSIVDTLSIITGVFAFFAANTFLNIYNIAIDTIFLCYCEDLAENDGVTRPYFMSRDLMRFMEDSKRTLGEVVRDIAGINEAPLQRVLGSPATGPI